MSEPTNLFEIKNLVKSFQKPGSISKRLVLNIDRLEVPRGQIVAVLGASGSGKTTLFNILGGIDTPDHVKGLQICLTLPGRRPRFLHRWFVRYPRKHIGYIFQSGYLLKSADIALNLALPRLAAGILAKRDDLGKYCKLVRLESSIKDEHGVAHTTAIPLDTHAFKLSGGEQQRVGLARALARDPAIIFADEPTSSLDPGLGLELMELLRDWIWAGEGKRTLLWVTHDYNLAAKLADSLFVIKAGQLSEESVRTGRPIANPGDPNLLEKLVYGDDEIPSGGEVPQTGALPVRETQASDPPKASALLATPMLNSVPETRSMTLPERTSGVGNELPATHLGAPSRGKPANHIIASLDVSRSIFSGVFTIFAGMKLGFQELFQPVGGEVKSVWQNTIEKGVFKALKFGYARFRYLVQTLIVFSILCLGASLYMLQNIVVSYFEQQLDSPKMRHVVVSGDNTQDDTILSKGRIAELNAAPPWKMAAVNTAMDKVMSKMQGLHSQNTATDGRGLSTNFAIPTTMQTTGADSNGWGKDEETCKLYQGPFAYGRMANLKQLVSEGTSPSNDNKHELRILKAYASEPILAELVVRNLAGQPLEKNLAEIFRHECLQDKPEIAIVLTSQGVEELKKKIRFNANSPTASLSIHAGPDAQWVPLKILGVVDVLPYDRSFIYRGFMDISSYRRWRVKMERGNIQEFERIAFYFEKDNFQHLFSYLKNKKYEFNLEIFDKFSGMISITNVFKKLFYLIIGIGGGVSLIVILASFLGYLRENEVAFAVLKAQGIGLAALLPAVLVQTSSIWLVAIGHLFVLAVILDLVNLAPTLVPGSGTISDSWLQGYQLGTFLQDRVMWEMIGSVAVVAVLMVLMMAGWWLLRMRRLADILRQS